MQTIFNIKLNKKIVFKTITVLFIFISLILPFLFVNFTANKGDSYTNSTNYSDLRYENEPKTQFSKDDYSPILEIEQSALGQINITNLYFNETGFTIWTLKYPNLDDDLNSGALKMIYKQTKFIRHVAPVEFTDYNEEKIQGIYTKIRVNESISVQYNKSKPGLEGYLFYLPRLNRVELLELWVENGTPSKLTKLNSGNYTIETISETQQNLLFYYDRFFKSNVYNFTFHLIYDFEVVIDSWDLQQETNQELVISEDKKSISPKYHYEFFLYGYKTPSDIIDHEIFADSLLLNLTISPMNKDLLFGHQFWINDQIVTTSFLHPDKSIYTNWQVSNRTHYYLEFFVTFTMDFVDPVDFSWGIDRLVADDDIRERIYFPRIISGPSRIYLKNVKILEETIAFDQIISASSIFERPVLFTEINVSQTEEETGQSLIFNEITTKRRGIKITMPYMILGEVCPFIIKYETGSNLKIVVTDNIGMPVSNLEVIIYYFGEEYGTYISSEKTQPLGPQITDENGEILLEKVPDGNYTVKVYYFNNVVKESEVSTFLEINYVPTTIIHIPIVVLIFGSIFGFVLIIGLFYRLRQEKSRNI